MPARSGPLRGNAMIRLSRVVVLIVAPLLVAAIWLDNQPSYKPYKPPVLPSPAGSVPVSGREQPAASNPVRQTPDSVARGADLFRINCVICHGQSSARPGPVGSKLKPPPPGLGHDMVQGVTDAAIFKAVTEGFGRMPPFRDKLTPLERWDLVNFVRTRN